MKTNKLWSTATMIALILGMLVSFYSCGNDEKTCKCNGDCHGTQCSAPCGSDCKCTLKPEPSENTDAIGGEYLSAVKGTESIGTKNSTWDLFRFSYTNGRISLYQSDYDGLEVSNVSDKEWRFDLGRYGKRTYKNVSYNARQHVTSFRVLHESNEYSYERDYTFTYDSNEQLVQIKGEGIDDKQWHNKISIYWSNNIIISVKVSGVDDHYHSQIDDTYTYTYNEQNNSNKQMPYVLAQNIFANQFNDLELISGLSLIGKFGNGPQKLPKTYSENEGVHSTITYVLNSNGNIMVETLGFSSGGGYEKYHYSYE